MYSGDPAFTQSTYTISLLKMTEKNCQKPLRCNKHIEEGQLRLISLQHLTAGQKYLKWSEDQFGLNF